ncbi:hypothetical protein [Thermus sp. NEB1569]|nr:hypothetical protein [Thermus sp. NEB1569]ULR39730.1 hypothetical protein MI302_00205 [Thermus sp. NEB1569]
MWEVEVRLPRKRVGGFAPRAVWIPEGLGFLKWLLPGADQANPPALRV